MLQFEYPNFRPPGPAEKSVMSYPLISLGQQSEFSDSPSPPAERSLGMDQMGGLIALRLLMGISPSTRPSIPFLVLQLDSKQ